MKPLLSLAASLALSTAAFSAPPAVLHIRGTVQNLKGGVLTVQTATATVPVSLPAKGIVLALVPSSRAAIKPGSFLGVASVAGSSGGQRARSVILFPEFARGKGAGSYPWDLPSSGGSGSRMTNGTVSMSHMTNGTVRSRMTNGTVKASSGGDELTLTYPSGSGTGSQTIRLAKGMPIYTFEPGSPALLTPGAHVFIAAHVDASGKTVADQTLVGKNGIVPPM